MANYKDDLYDLIHCLSKSEKRHFKMMVPTTENRQHIELFDIINNIKEYDKIAINQRIEQHTWAKHSPVLRNYLYLLILRSLRQLHESENIDAQITALLHNAQLFRQRYQLLRSRQQITKAKSLAVFYEKTSLELKTLEEERILLDVLFFKDDQEHLEEIQNNEKEQARCLELLQNAHQYKVLLSQARALGHRIFQKNEANLLHELEDLLATPLLQNIELAHTLAARHFFYLARTKCLFYLRRYDLYHIDCQANAAIWENVDLAIVAEYPNMYQSALYNLLIYQLYAKNRVEFDETADKLEALLLNPAFEESHALIFVRLLGVQLHFLGDEGDLPKALQIIEAKVVNFKKHAEKCSVRDSVATAFAIGRSYFYAHQFQKAYDWFQYLLEQFAQSHRGDLLLVARALQIIAEFELRQTPLLEHLTRSARRFVQKRTNLYKIPLLVIQYVEKIVEAFNPNARNLLYLELKEKTNELLDNPLEFSVVHIFNFSIWIESHLQKKKMYELLVAKNDKNV